MPSKFSFKKIAKYTLFAVTGIVVILIISLIVLGGGFGSKNNPTINNGNALLFAHRGVTEFSIENSIEAFDKSEELGFAAIETDISRTKEGKLIIFHDENAKRLLNIDKKINEMYWDEIKDKYLYYDGKETQNKVLSLEQFLNKTKKTTILYLDIKEGSKAVADSVLVMLEKHKGNKNIIVADASISFLIYLKIKSPTIKVALEGFNKGKEALYYIMPKNFKPDFYSSFISQVDENHMGFLKENNLLNNRIVYGVDNENMSDVLELGLHNVIFDFESKTDTSDVKSIELRLTKNKMQ